MWSARKSFAAFIYRDGEFKLVGPRNEGAELNAVNARGHATGDNSAAQALFWNGKRLLTKAVFDFEADPTLSIRVRATDIEGASYAKSLTVTVSDVKENTAPVALMDFFGLPKSGSIAISSAMLLGNDRDFDNDSMTVQIASLRKALGHPHDWIVTVPRVGYRLATGGRVDVPDDHPSPPVLAVLPFRHVGSDADYFADGVVEDIVTALSRFRSFTVLTTGASFATGIGTDIREAAKALGVRYVLHGSVRRVGERLDLTRGDIVENPAVFCDNAVE